MTPEARAAELAHRFLEDFDISTELQRYQGLKARVLGAITEERERCAKVAETHFPRSVYTELTLNEVTLAIAQAIRKG